jgi:hypothetical protein
MAGLERDPWRRLPNFVGPAQAVYGKAAVVPLARLELALLSKLDFESGSDYSKILDFIEFSRDFALVC